MTAQIGQLVRSLLVDDFEAYPERTSELDEPGWNAFGEIVGAAFYRVVTERFRSAVPGLEDDVPIGEPDPDAEPEPRGEISLFVAEAAEPWAGTAVEIDAAAAEALVRSVLGDDGGVGPVLDELDEPDLARIELVLLRALLADGEESVDDVISGAEGEAADFSGPAG